MSLPLDVPIVDGPFPHSCNTFKILLLFNSNYSKFDFLSCTENFKALFKFKDLLSSVLFITKWLFKEIEQFSVYFLAQTNNYLNFDRQRGEFENNIFVLYLSIDDDLWWSTETRYLWLKLNSTLHLGHCRRRQRRLKLTKFSPFQNKVSLSSTWRTSRLLRMHLIAKS